MYYKMLYLKYEKNNKRSSDGIDEQKNDSNKRKHGISFETAARVFDDENCIEIYGEEHSLEEERYIVLELVRKVLFVVYTDRADATRIISARKATKAETEAYYGDYTQDDL